MAKIGELSFEVVVNGKKAVATIKNFGNVVNTVTQNSRTELNRMRSTFDRVSAFAEKAFFTISSFKMLAQPLGRTVQVANQFENSNRKLDATSKLTGQSLDFLQNTAKTAKEQFSLNTVQANEFTIALSKLGQKAGDTEKTSEAISRLLDLAAAQGLNAEQALVAINQAILGIDEGTDKLFQKNPSAIYAEYAKQIGTTAGKLNDQQKAQALLNAVLQDGQKVQGEYQKFLESAAGKQSQAAARAQELQAQIGKVINLALVPILEIATPVLQSFTNLSAGMQRTIAVLGLLVAAGWKLIPMFQAWNTSITVLGVSIKAALGWIGVIVSIAGLLYTAWANNLGGIQGVVGGVWRYLKAFFKSVWEVIKFYVGLYKEAFLGLAKVVERVFKFDFSGAKQAFRETKDAILADGAELRDKLGEIWEDTQKVQEKSDADKVKTAVSTAQKTAASVLSSGQKTTKTLKKQQREREVLRKLEIANIQDDFIRRRAELDVWFDEQSKKYSGNAKIIEQLEVQKSTRLNEINDSFVAQQIREFSELETKSTDVLRSELAQRRTNVSEYFSQLVEENQGNADLIKSLQQQKIAALIQLDEQFAAAEKEISIEVKNIKIQAIDDEFQRRLAAVEQSFAREQEKWQGNSEALQAIESRKSAETLNIVRDFSEQKTSQFSNTEVETTAILLQEVQTREQEITRVFDNIIEKNQNNSELVHALEDEKYKAITQLDQAYYERKKQLDEQAWQEFQAENQGAINVVRSGWDAFFSTLTDAEMTAAERRKRIFESMKNAFLGQVKQMLQGWIVAKAREIVVHTTAETTKTKTTQSQTAVRSAISLEAIAREIGRVLASVGAFLAQMTAKLFSWFAGMGPLGILAGLGAVPALIASVKGLVKSAARFKDGGIVKEQVLAMIGEAGDSEAVIPLNARGAGFMAQLLPKIIVPSSPPAQQINYKRLGEKVAEAVAAQPIQINAELDALQFFRDEFPRYEKAEIKRKL